MPDGTSGSFTFLHVAEYGGVPPLFFWTSDASSCAPNSLGACGRMGALRRSLACCSLSIKPVGGALEKVGEGPNFCFCRPHRLSALCKCAPVIGLRAVECRSVNRADAPRHRTPDSDSSAQRGRC